MVAIIAALKCCVFFIDLLKEQQKTILSQPQAKMFLN
jgi:hypothetical protein